MQAMKPCPYCAEEIRAEARRCRYCRSRLFSLEAEHWHRSHPEARLAGVCAALSHMLALPVSLIRLLFIVFTFVLHVAPLVYLALWLILPRHAGGSSNLEYLLQQALDLAGMARAPRRDASDIDRRPPAPPSAPHSSRDDGPTAAHLLS